MADPGQHFYIQKNLWANKYYIRPYSSYQVLTNGDDQGSTPKCSLKPSSYLSFKGTYEYDELYFEKRSPKKVVYPQIIHKLAKTFFKNPKFSDGISAEKVIDNDATTGAQCGTSDCEFSVDVGDANQRIDSIFIEPVTQCGILISNRGIGCVKSILKLPIFKIKITYFNVK